MTSALRFAAVLSIASALGVNSTFAADNNNDNTAPSGFTALFNGRDLTNWKIPDGDGGHWKVLDGVIDYDAQSEATGDKTLWSTGEYTDFILRVDWRIKETPYTNPNVPYILPDGSHARDVHGKEMKMALPDSDSGIYLRGDADYQVNIWCWPIGSGEMYGVRTNPKTPPEVRAAVTPRTQADKPVGEWNRFEITVRGIPSRWCSTARPSFPVPKSPICRSVENWRCNITAANRMDNGTAHPACCNLGIFSFRNWGSRGGRSVVRCRRSAVGRSPETLSQTLSQTLSIPAVGSRSDGRTVGS